MEAAAGLGALGFWLFIAAIVVAGIWFDVRTICLAVVL